MRSDLLEHGGKWVLSWSGVTRAQTLPRVCEEGPRGLGVRKRGLPTSFAGGLELRRASRATTRFPKRTYQWRSPLPGRPAAHSCLGPGPTLSPRRPRPEPRACPGAVPQSARVQAGPRLRALRGGRAQRGVPGQGPAEEAAASPPAGLAFTLALALRLARAPRG